MKYRCPKCNYVFDQSELKVRSSYLCEYGQTPVYEDIYVCPRCGGDEMYEVVCKEKDEESIYDATVDDCVEISKAEGKHMIEINAFLASSFTAAEIEDILIDALKKDPHSAIVSYISGDPEWFEENFNRMERERT